MTRLVADFHLHIYKVFPTETLLRALFDNLNRLAGTPRDGEPVVKAAFLAERRRYRIFQDWHRGLFRIRGFSVAPRGPHTTTVPPTSTSSTSEITSSRSIPAGRTRAVIWRAAMSSSSKSCGAKRSLRPSMQPIPKCRGIACHVSVRVTSRRRLHSALAMALRCWLPRPDTARHRRR